VLVVLVVLPFSIRQLLEAMAQILYSVLLPQ
jgi:cation transport regulator ChaB